MDSQALLLHQVHPAKLGTDITAAAVSTMLLWRHHLWPGLLVRYLPATPPRCCCAAGAGNASPRSPPPRPGGTSWPTCPSPRS
jgi:hypothetical protein